MKKLSALVLSACCLFFCFAVENTVQSGDFTVQFSDTFPMMHPQLVYESSSLQVATAISEGLFTYDPYSCQPVKALVESYTIAGKTWRFTLRSDACFENGDKITAETVKKSWMNLLSPEVDFAYASLLDCIQGALEYRTGKSSAADVAINVESENTLSVYLNEPTPHLAGILCNPAFAVIHPSQLKYAVDYLKSPKRITAKNAFIPISSGPFKVKSYDAKQVVFIPNEKYWDADSIELKRLVVRMDMDDDQKAESFNSGELNWVKYAPIDKIVGTSTISYSPIFATTFFFFNVQNAAVKNPAVRKALLLAIPYEKFRADTAMPATTFVYPLAGYPEVDGIKEYNPEQAKKELDKLKLKPEQKKITIKVYDFDYQKELAGILKSAWEEIGFTVTIKLVDESEDLQVVLHTQDYSLGLMTWIADFADPIAMLELFRKGSTLNESGWQDEKFSGLLDKAGSKTSIGERYKILGQAEQYLLDEGMVIPLSFSFNLNIIDMSEVAGWYPNPLDIHPFKFIKFKTKALAPGFI